MTLSSDAPSVLLACPTRSAIRPDTTRAIVAATMGLRALGIRCGYKDERTGGITLARSLIGARLLKDGDYGGVLLIDDDVCNFTAQDVARFVLSGEDVVGGPVPQRNVNPDTVVAAVLAGVRGPELLRFLSPLMFVPKTGKNVRVRGSLLEVERIGTGFLYISRRALEAVTAGTDAMGSVETVPYPVPLVFDYMTTESGQFVGEDYAFCAKWQWLGGIVWADTLTELGHVGDQAFASKSLAYHYGIGPERAKRAPTLPAPPPDASAAGETEPLLVNATFERA